MPPAALSDKCAHTKLLLNPSPHAAEAGYRDFTPQQLANASGHGKKGAKPTACFSRPLVLPGDDLSEDPRCPGQSLRSWLREPDRNEVTSQRNVIYVAAPPTIDRDGKELEQWASPQTSNCPVTARLQAGRTAQGSATLDIEDVETYLSAFYTGMAVSRLSPDFRFTNWDNPGSSKGKGRSLPKFVGLQRHDEIVGIRVRPCPHGMFKAQLNLNDILDAAISALPANAYALLLVVHQDLYEDENDDFCCGRAYGGSRVAVVSSSRYNPSLDEVQGIEREHAWPASHCAAYVSEACTTFERSIRPRKKAKNNHTTVSNTETSFAMSASSSDEASPIQAAVTAHKSLRQQYSTPRDIFNLWTARLCRTASHELGHCFGMGHCVYYACVMQSTASLAEDVRQPPYLCPVDLAKLLRATGATDMKHYAALQNFCSSHESTHMFAALGAWAKARLVQLQGSAT